MKTNSKEFRALIQPYILDCINLDGYDTVKYGCENPVTDKEKLNVMHSIFLDEYDNAYNRKVYGNEQNIFAEWLQGGASAMRIASYNHEILELAVRLQSIPAGYTDKEADKILGNYWNFMAYQILAFRSRLNK